MTNFSQPYTPIKNIEDLLSIFYDAEKPKNLFAIGTEVEKPGIYEETKQPVPYDGHRSISTILSLFISKFGWKPEDPEYKNGPLIALSRGQASITLEPAGQLELSGAPLKTIHETAIETKNHLDELEAISKDLGIVWLGTGFHPFAKDEDLPWVPKSRYGIMKNYLPTRTSTGLDMMRRTCTVQANLDYENEEDAMKKLMVALKIQPIVTAMFANSPSVESQYTNEKSHRAWVWIHMDPDRSGLLPALWESQPTYLKYIEWALDIPMFLIKRDEQIFPNTQQTFRTFLKEGSHGLQATKADWEMHLNTLFPEVRLKKTIEVRGADAQKEPLLSALPALWKGLLYEETALEQATKLANRISYADISQTRLQIPTQALQAKLGNQEVAIWAQEIIQIAEDGLMRINACDENGLNETQYLKPLKTLIQKGKCPADELLEKVNKEHFTDDVVKFTRLR